MKEKKTKAAREPLPSKSREETKKAIKRKKTQIVLAVLFVYLVVLVAAAIIIDDRHIEITLLGPDVDIAEVGETYADLGAQAFFTGNLFGKSVNPIEIKTESGVDVDRIGDYTVKYTAEAFLYATQHLPSSRSTTRKGISQAGWSAIRRKALPRSTTMTAT